MEPRTVTPVSAIVFGDDAVVFDVELFLRSGSVLAFDDEVGGLPDFFGDWGLVLLHQVGLEGVGVVRLRPR